MIPHPVPLVIAENYATLNPATKGPYTTLSRLNTTMNRTVNASNQYALTATGKSAGKWYFEANAFFVNGGSSVNVGKTTGVNNGTGTVAVYDTGVLQNAGTTVATGLGTIASTGTIVRVAVDAGSELAWFAIAGGYWNGNSGYSPGGTGGVYTGGLSATLYPSGTLGYNINSADGIIFNFGQTGFSYSVPSGFVAGWTA